MKEKVNINSIQANIENLTSLWQIASTSHQSYFTSNIVSYGWIENSDWPNRIWYHQDINQEIIDTTKKIIETSPVKLTIPYWNISGGTANKILEENGFKILFEQLGMSLKLHTPFTEQNDLNIRRVSNRSEATLWSELFVRSFGYRIHPDTLVKTITKIDYYLAYHQGQAIGTAILHKTDTVVGVHSVGIPPEFRKRGFASQIMKLLINLAIIEGGDYMTLQASDMGKNIYLKLGFEEQFVIKNYTQ